MQSAVILHWAGISKIPLLITKNTPSVSKDNNDPMYITLDIFTQLNNVKRGPHPPDLSVGDPY